MNYSFNPKVRAISHVSFLFVWHKKLPAIFATLGNLIMEAREALNNSKSEPGIATRK